MTTEAPDDPGDPGAGLPITDGGSETNSSREAQPEIKGTETDAGPAQDAPAQDSSRKQRAAGISEAIVSTRNVEATLSKGDAHPGQGMVRRTQTEDEDSKSESDEPLSIEVLYVSLTLELEANGRQQLEDSLLPQTQKLFTLIYAGTLFNRVTIPAEKKRYPSLTRKEGELLIDVMELATLLPGNGVRRFTQSVEDCVRGLHSKSVWMLDQFIENACVDMRIRGQPQTNPWTGKTSARDTDDPMGETTENHGPFVFNTEMYTTPEIEEMQRLCTRPCDPPRFIRPATELELKVIDGLAEGNIVGYFLPQFIKMVMRTQRRLQLLRTIQLQVEGELIVQLPPDLTLYQDYQSTKRLAEVIQAAGRTQSVWNSTLEQLMGQVKVILYDSDRHALRMTFLTRKAASTFHCTAIPFRIRLLEARDVYADTEERTSVWDRQTVGSTLRRRAANYRVQVLNISPLSMNISRFREFIASRTKVHFDLDPVDDGGRTSNLSLVWELVFHIPGCPEFLKGICSITWFGKNLILHHISVNPRPPCMACGATGHMVKNCKTSSTLDTNRIVVAEAEADCLIAEDSPFSSIQDLREHLEQDYKEQEEARQTASKVPSETAATPETERAVETKKKVEESEEITSDSTKSPLQQKPVETALTQSKQQQVQAELNNGFMMIQRKKKRKSKKKVKQPKIVTDIQTMQQGQMQAQGSYYAAFGEDEDDDDGETDEQDPARKKAEQTDGSNRGSRLTCQHLLPSRMLSLTSPREIAMNWMKLSTFNSGEVSAPTTSNQSNGPLWGGTKKWTATLPPSRWQMWQREQECGWNPLGRPEIVNSTQWFKDSSDWNPIGLTMLCGSKEQQPNSRETSNR